MRVAQQLEVLDLALDTRIHVRGGNLAPVDELECDLVTRDGMGCDCKTQRQWSVDTVTAVSSTLRHDSRLTLPKLPVPRVRSMMYWPIRGFGRAARCSVAPAGMSRLCRPEGTGGAGRVAMGGVVVVVVGNGGELSVRKGGKVVVSRHGGMMVVVERGLSVVCCTVEVEGRGREVAWAARRHQG